MTCTADTETKVISLCIWIELWLLRNHSSHLHCRHGCGEFRLGMDEFHELKLLLLVVSSDTDPRFDCGSVAWWLSHLQRCT